MELSYRTSLPRIESFALEETQPSWASSDWLRVPRRRVARHSVPIGRAASTLKRIVTDDVVRAPLQRTLKKPV
jgi:hypothetical protein